ncbi:hypothetical protein [Nocardiopsis sp. ATB16-24]|uniref:hypothetical protein n=1 Tax=Nocardiopsis sp. ATB16-24 TaxID=3019555 RepID=UPI0025551DC3|nr:hypothetical protein [Nocardiopsis sp. ATB16-24]
MGRRGYPAEFRRKVLDLVQAGRSVADVAREIRDRLVAFTATPFHTPTPKR